jgi:hypothetical protein
MAFEVTITILAPDFVGNRVRIGQRDDDPRRCPRDDRRAPFATDHRIRYAGDLAEARVGIDVPVVLVGLEDPDRSGVGEEPELVGRFLHFPSRSGELFGLDEEVRERRDLGSQLGGRNRREDEVDGTLGVEIGAVDLVASVRSDEDDRSHLRLLTLTDSRGRLEPVHDRHEHVEQDHREVLLSHATKGGKTGVGFDDRVSEREQHRFQREPLAGIVVDQQDRDARLHDADRAVAGSQGRRAARSSVVSTGLGT